MNRRRAVLAIVRKDVRAIFANLQVWLPMLIVPVVLGILVPGGITWGILRFGEGNSEMQDIIRLLDQLPAGNLLDSIARFDGIRQQAVFFMANYLLAPFFLLIPVMAASTISADSFAGEKERGTLESLLFSPISVDVLFIGKVLASFLPAIGLAWGTFLLTVITVNAIAWPWMGQVFFPTLNWLPLMLLVIPLLSLATIFLTVFVSARVRTFQAAYQLGGIVSLPVIGLVVGQLTGVLFLSMTVIILIAAALLVLNVILLFMLRGFLDRPALFESQVQ